MWATIFLPVHDHAGLRKRESQERANGIERDKPVRDSSEKQENAATEQCQDDDAVGVYQTTSPVAENVGQVIILSNGTAEPGKIGERSVGRQRQYDQDGSNRQIVKESFAKTAAVSMERTL